MPATATPKERVMAAALDEFARHGVAGARVDRIARAAKTSKERVYAYFRSKEDLYAAVAADQLQGSVGELFAFSAEPPDMLRLVGGSRLEPNEQLVGLGEPGTTSLRAKLDA